MKLGIGTAQFGLNYGVSNTEGINVHYIPVYFHPYYRRLGYERGSCPVAEEYYSRAISIPMFSKLSDEEIEYVIGKIEQVIVN